MWGGGWRSSVHQHAPLLLPPPLLCPLSCLGYSPCAGLRALRMNGAQALLGL